jgi:hypothetical protein
VDFAIKSCWSYVCNESVIVQLIPSPKQLDACLEDSAFFWEYLGFNTSYHMTPNI